MTFSFSALADIPNGRYYGGIMISLLIIIALAVVWLLLQKVILPRLGIAT